MKSDLVLKSTRIVCGLLESGETLLPGCLVPYNQFSDVQADTLIWVLTKGAEKKDKTLVACLRDNWFR